MKNTPSFSLNVESLPSIGMPGLSAKRANSITEAAVCCLMQNAHTSGLQVSVQATSDSTISLSWESELTDEMKRSWADTDEAAEDGASAIAILLAHLFDDQVVVNRSVKGTGFDYFLCHKDQLDDPPRTNQLPFNFTKRLEVSGLFNQPASAVRARMQTKIKQTERYDSNWDIPAFIGIIEFGQPEMHLLERAKD